METYSELFVDGIEEGWARVLLGDEPFSIPASLLPPDTRPGQWVKLAVLPSPDRTEAVRQRVEDLQNELDRN